MELDHRKGKRRSKKDIEGVPTYLYTPCIRRKERVQECLHQKQKVPIYIIYNIYRKNQI